MKRKMIYSILFVVALLLCRQGYEFWVAVGRQSRGERLERCKKSPQWRDGEFVNVHETPTLTGDDRCVVMPRLAFYLRSFCVNLLKSLVCYRLFL